MLGERSFVAKNEHKGGMFLTLEDELDDLRKMAKTKYEIYSEGFENKRFPSL